jgi:hypothetical protein
MNTVPRVFAYLRRYPWMASGMLGCAILSTLMVLVFPAVTKTVIDEVLIRHHPERLLPLVLTAGLAFLLQQGLNSLRLILNNTFEQRVIFDLRSDLYSHIQMLPLRWFDNRATGDLMTRILEDVTSVERMLIDGIEQGVASARCRPWHDVLFQRFVDVRGTGAAPDTGGGSALVHPHGASAISAATTRGFGDELASARQSRGDSPDQKLRPRGCGTRAVQIGEQSAPGRDTGGDASLGALQPVDGFDRVAWDRSDGVGGRANGFGGQYAGRGFARVPDVDRVSLRAGAQTSSAQSAGAGGPCGGRARV